MSVSSVWSVTILGQPPSVNDIYAPVWRYDRRGRKYKGIGKKAEADKYQRDAQLQFQSARPSHWNPEGFIRLTYRFYLANDADCDNLKKLLHDALQAATGINDTWYLSTDQLKVKVPRKEARVEIDIAPESASPGPAGSPDPPPSTSSRSS